MYAVHPAMATVMFKVWEWIIPNKDVLLFLCYLAQPFIITLIIMHHFTTFKQKCRMRHFGV